MLALGFVVLGNRSQERGYLPVALARSGVEFYSNEQEEAPKERSLKRRDKFTRVNGNKELEKVLEKLG